MAPPALPPHSHTHLPSAICPSLSLLTCHPLSHLPSAPPPPPRGLVTGLEGTPEGVENNGSITRVGAFPIGIDPERFTRALETDEVQSHIAKLLNRYAGRKVGGRGEQGGAGSREDRGAGGKRGGRGGGQAGKVETEQGYMALEQEKLDAERASKIIDHTNMEIQHSHKKDMDYAAHNLKAHELGHKIATSHRVTGHPHFSGKV